MAGPFRSSHKLGNNKADPKYDMWVVYEFVEKGVSHATKLYNFVAIIGLKGVISSYKKMFPTKPEEYMRGLQPGFHKLWTLPIGLIYTRPSYLTNKHRTGVKLWISG